MDTERASLPTFTNVGWSVEMVLVRTLIQPDGVAHVEAPGNGELLRFILVYLFLPLYSADMVRTLRMMAGIGIFIVVVALTVYGSFAATIKKFEIRVMGTKGLTFRGSYMVVNGGGTESQGVSGVLPATFTAEGTRISVVFEKTVAGDAMLAVEILRDGKSVKRGKTTADYGMVTIATD